MESVVRMKGFNNIYKDKTVLVTGHTGFKGSWLSIWLHELGAKVIGYALDPYTERDNFVLSKIGEKIVDIRGDIRDKGKLEEVFKNENRSGFFDTRFFSSNTFKLDNSNFK